jgi:hypothetical protein
MAQEINTNNNRASLTGFDDTIANLNLSDDTVQRALENLDGRLDANEASIGALQTGSSDGSLNGLSDVTITSATTDQVLKYNGTAWVNDTISGGGAGSIALNDVTDVTLTSPADNEVLAYDSTSGEFINQTAGEAGLATSTHVHVASDIQTGTFADARIAESSVTQHQAALSITESQISDLGTYLTDITSQSINALSDVSITSAANNEVLTYNGTNWVNSAASGGGATVFTDLTDVTIPSPSDGQLVYYTSTGGGLYTAGAPSTILNNTLNLNQLADVEDNVAITGDVPIYNGAAWILRPPVINDMDDVQGTPTDGQVLTWNNTGSYWEPQTAGAVSEVNDLTASVTWANVPDANITQSSVTQHQGALSITESQISDLGTYLTGITGQSIGNLSDVVLTSPSSTQVLKHNGTNFVNTLLSTSDITSGTFLNARIAESNVTQHQAALSITESQISDLGSYLTDITGQAIGSLSDVVFTSATSGDLLQYNGTNWVNFTPNYLTTIDISSENLADLSDVGGTAPTDGQVLTYSTTNSRWEAATASGGGGGATFSGAKVRVSSSDFSLGTGTTVETEVQFDTQDYDTDSYHSTSTNPSRFTIPSAGVYQITGCISIDNSGTGTKNYHMILRMYKNGSLTAFVGGGYKENAISGTDIGAAFTYTFEAAANDYYEINAYVQQNDSREAKVEGNNTLDISWMAITRLKDGAV